MNEEKPAVLGGNPDHDLGSFDEDCVEEIRIGWDRWSHHDDLELESPDFV